MGISGHDSFLDFRILTCAVLPRDFPTYSLCSLYHDLTPSKRCATSAWPNVYAIFHMYTVQASSWKFSRLISLSPNSLVCL